MSVTIHPTAMVEKGAELGVDVEVGAFCFIGPRVKASDGCKFRPYSYIIGDTLIGKKNEFFPFTSIGAEPQDISYDGTETSLEIGDGNTFREYVSIHRGSTKQDHKTVVGANNFVMEYAHFGHDVAMGNNNVIANNVQLAGHVKIENNATISGSTSIAQFITIGRSSYIGAGSLIDRDIPHFCTAYGNRAQLKGINIIGLRRQGHSKQSISELVNFYRMLEASPLSPRSFIEKEELMEEFKGNPLVDEISTFIRGSNIGILPFAN